MAHRLTRVLFKTAELFIDEGNRGCTLRVGENVMLTLVSADEVRRLENELALVRARLEANR